MWLLGFSLAVFQTASFAATVGQWTSSSDVWSAASNYSTIYAASTVAGNKFDPTAEGISGASLAGNSHFIISNPTSLGQPGEVGTLKSWVNAGGTLVMFANPDAGFSMYTSYFMNALLSGIGSSMSVMSQAYGFGGAQLLGTLGGSDQSVAGIQGGGLASGSVLPVLGGNSIAVSGALLPYLVRYEQIGSGKVYVIGGNIASNALIAEGANRQFLLNLLSQGNAGIGFADDVPEPASIGLTAIGLIAAAVARRRSKA